MTLLSRGLVTLRLERVRFRPTPDHGPLDSCPRCSGHLLMTQPDPENPDRMIGTCLDCESWYLAEWTSEDATLELVALPSRAASREGPAVTTRWAEEVLDIRPFQAGA